jgi:hypothetical protein
MENKIAGNSAPPTVNTEPRTGGAAERPVLRLPPVDGTPPEKRTISQIIAAQRDHQAGIALECEVREVARSLGLPEPEARRLAAASRVGFRIVNGEPVPVAEDRQTVVRSADGVNVMSVAEWVAQQARATSPQPAPRSGEGGNLPSGQPPAEMWPGEEEVLPQPNPFRRKTWNLTEQMRLQRRDPRQARRLKAEACAAGES